MIKRRMVQVLGWTVKLVWRLRGALRIVKRPQVLPPTMTPACCSPPRRSAWPRASCAAAQALLVGLLAAPAPRSALPAPCRPEPPPAAARAGLREGDKIPSFYVRAVTGSLKNRSVCYVCRYGDRPVVMVLVWHWHAGLLEMLQQIDRQLDGHRAQGLRGFVVFTPNDKRELLPRVQTLAFEGKLEIPLTIAAATAEGLAAGDLAAGDLAVSVVLYRDQTVHQALHLPQSEWKPAMLDQVARAVRALAEPDAPPRT